MSDEPPVAEIRPSVVPGRCACGQRRLDYGDGTFGDAFYTLNTTKTLVGWVREVSVYPQARHRTAKCQSGAAPFTVRQWTWRKPTGGTSAAAVGRRDR